MRVGRKGARMWRKRLTSRVASFGVKGVIMVMLRVKKFFSLEKHHSGELHASHHSVVRIIIDWEFH